MENRKKQLEFFLRECAKRKDIESNPNFKAFLEIDKHSPDLTYNAPNIIYENSELPQGIRDFFFFEEANIMYIVCCDMKIASRLDAYVTNVNLPWEKKTDAHISVGSVFAFKVILDKKGIPHLYFSSGHIPLSQGRCNQHLPPCGYPSAGIFRHIQKHEPDLQRYMLYSNLRRPY